MEYAVIFLPLVGSILGFLGKSLIKYFSEITTSLFVCISAVFSIVLFWNGIQDNTYGNFLIFEWISSIFVTVLQFSKQGALFLFGETLVNSNEFGAIFAFQILPTILFFSALTSLLFYLGVLQKIVYVFAYAMKKTLNLSGAESLSAAGNIFLAKQNLHFLLSRTLKR